VIELVSKLLYKRGKFKHLAIRLNSSQKWMLSLYECSDTGAL